MSGDALALIAGWRERTRTARAAGDTATVAAVLRDAVSLDLETLQPPTRAAGHALAALAADLIDVPEPNALETLFNRALAIFQQAPDAQLGDLLTTWNNLAALYDRHGANDHRNRVYGIVGGIAERYEGPLDVASATVFMSLGELFRQHRSFPGMLVMYRQVQRFMLDASDTPDETLALWLHRYATGLAEADRADEIDAALERALITLEARAEPQPLSAGKCLVLLAERRAARGDLTGAAELFERVVSVPALPEEARTDALSSAGRAFYKAGGYDRASQCFVRAVRRRAGLQDAPANPGP
jgi:hypothetical protein